MKQQSARGLKRLLVYGLIVLAVLGVFVAYQMFQAHQRSQEAGEQILRNLERERANRGR